MSLNKPFPKIVILGAGLMGGSLALRLREKNIAESIWAIARSKKRAAEIDRFKIFDFVTSSYEKALDSASFVIMAAPVKTICAFIPVLEEIFSRDFDQSFPVTDLGSVKEPIHLCVDRTRYVKKCFVGSHPLCGSEKSGIEYADSLLYRNAVCVITGRKNRGAFDFVKRFWDKVGLETVTMTPRRHDRILARTSHLPHVLSMVYAGLLKKHDPVLSGNSLKDLLRLAQADPVLWQNVFETNRDTLEPVIEQYIEALKHFKEILRRNDSKEMIKYIKNSRKPL